MKTIGASGVLVVYSVPAWSSKNDIQMPKIHDQWSVICLLRACRRVYSCIAIFIDGEGAPESRIKPSS